MIIVNYNDFDKNKDKILDLSAITGSGFFQEPSPCHRIRPWSLIPGVAMSFKENLLKKIKINTLADTVLNSLGTPDSGKKLDKHAMRTLLDMNGFSNQKTRDLDLYVQDDGRAEKRIMVLGNELAFFRTTLADVAMRRSPTVKEMISIRNAIKILNDKDIVISKGADTVETIRRECLDSLDLTYNEADVDEIVQDGIASLKNSYSDGIIEALVLFAELLAYQNPPKELQIRHCRLFGRASRTEAGSLRFGPMVIYAMMQNALKYCDESVAVSSKQAIAHIEKIISGDESAFCEGPDVFYELKRLVLKNV